MPRPKALILRAPGTNCDGEAAFALESVGATCEKLHINALREKPAALRNYQILILPGGFAPFPLETASPDQILQAILYPDEGQHER